MIRIGIVWSVDDQAWTGGANYYRNLLRAVEALPDRQIQPVVLTADEASTRALRDLTSVEVLQSPRFDIAGARWKFGKAAQRLIGRDPLLERCLHSHGIDVLSHSGHLGPRSGIPTIAWIPDFQHVRLPAMFDAAERAARDARLRRLCAWATIVLLSSHDAHGDFMAFAPAHAAKGRVLPFVCAVDDGHASADRQLVSARYGLEGSYFHVPNQFWAHKNHRVVIEALAMLRDSGRRSVVISTGSNGHDGLSAHVKALRALITRRRLEDDFRVLGLVPYEQVRALMRQAVAVINPSLFEGWSTSVEESKSLGKMVILSDIPVHREQNPQRGVYFDPNDPAALASAMTYVLDTYSASQERESRASAQSALPKRLANFAERYQAIVLSVLGTSLHDANRD